MGRTRYDGWDGRVVNTRRRPSLVVPTVLVVLALLAPLAASAAGTASISGRVTASDGVTPLAGITVGLHKNTSGSWSDYGTTTTGTDGRYSFGGLINTTYAVEFSDAGAHIPEYYSDKPSLAGADVILLGATEDRTGIDASLALASGISGTVRDSAGQPVAGIVVNAYRHLGGTSYDTVAAATATTASDGTYSIGGIAAGAYGLQFFSGAYASHFRGAGATTGVTAISRATPVTVLTGQAVAGIDETMLKWGAIAGTVSGSTGPLDNVTVQSFHYETATWTPQTAALTQTLSDGTFAASRVYPGRYRVLFTAPTGYPPQYHRSALSTELGADVVVAENTTTQLDTRLVAADATPPSSSVSGIPAGWSNSITASVTSTDGSAGSGVAAIYYGFGSDAPTLYGGPFSVTGEGSRVLSYWAVDGFGNREENKTVTVMLDVTAPTTSAIVNSTYVLSASITIVSSDSQSGVAWTDYQLDTSAPASGTVAATSALGSHAIKHRAMDNAGNLGDWSTPQYFVVVVRTYTLTYSAGANGTILGTSPQTVDSGGSGTAVTAIPSTGYHFVKWSDGVLTAARTDTNVTADKSVSASFAIDTHTITSSAGANGLISPLGAQTVPSGGSKVFTITPNSGYRVADVLVNGSSVGAVTSYTFTNVTSNGTISATFVVNTYTITSSAGANGSISPLGAQTVLPGGSKAFTITPAAGYRVATVLVDSVSVGAPTSHTFNNVTANHTISVTFVADSVTTYTITSSAGANGSISPLGVQTVSSGGSLAFTITPASGYHVVDVLVNGSSIGAATSNTFTNVTSNQTLSATFGINTYTLTYTAGANGTISGTSSQTVDYNGSGTAITAVPNTGYHFLSWSDGSTANPRTDSGVTADKSVTANFAVDAPTPVLMPVYRFYNMRTGVHFYTASEAEKDNVVATLAAVYRLEGVAYYLNTANLANDTALYRFYNFRKGVHFYTASEAEKNNVIATLASTYRLEGVAYNVSSSPAGGATPVYRFLNFKQGVHFYTASESEKANVIATLGAVYRLEGIGYYLAP